MEYEDAINISNFSEVKEITPEQSRKVLYHEIFFLIFTIVAFCADLAIVYVMLRYKRMRVPSNIYIANWAITDMLSLIVCPSAYRILSVIGNFPLYGKFACILFQIGAALHFSVMLAVFVVSWDWCSAAFFPNCSKKVHNYQKIVIGVQWCITIGLCFLFIEACQSLFLFELLALIILFLIFCGMSLIIFIFQIVRAIKKCRRNPITYPPLLLNLATGFSLTYILAFLNLLMFDFFRLSNPIFYAISCCILFSNSLVNITILCMTYRDFRLYLLQTIRCLKNRKLGDFSEFDNADDIYKEQFQVSFHNPTGEILTSVS